ncbi:MAG: hypothetical protein ACI97K_001240 [Glaciecola sp.]|jgi:hypothetical protein
MKIHSKATKSLNIFIAFVISILSINASASETEGVISISPKQCIALNQGNLCYLDIEITWSLQEQGNYCLFSSQQESSLQCWQGKRVGDFAREIVAKENVVFSLKPQNSKIILGSAKLEMAWVYKKNNRSHSTWRMF